MLENYIYLIWALKTSKSITKTNKFTFKMNGNMSGNKDKKKSCQSANYLLISYILLEPNIDQFKKNVIS